MVVRPKIDKMSSVKFTLTHKRRQIINETKSLKERQKFCKNVAVDIKIILIGLFMISLLAESFQVSHQSQFFSAMQC